MPSTRTRSSKKRKIDNTSCQPCSQSYEKAPTSHISTRFIDVFDSETYYPLFSTLCQYLSIAEIVALTKTCKKFSKLYKYLLPIQWDVDQKLRRFVQDPYRFRSQMAQYDALISGSFVIQFFERVTWRASDLDVFVENGKRAESFRHYLVGEEGYTEISNKDITDYEANGYIEIYTYTKKREHEINTSDAKIQIIITSEVPIKSILLGFYTTVVVNVMSWNKAYALFPLPTFVQHKGYQLKALGRYCRRGVMKYSMRGWNMQETMWPEEKRSNHPIRAIRRVGDRFTWTICFETRKVQWSKTPDSVLEHACFSMGARGQFPNHEQNLGASLASWGSRYYTIVTETLRGHTLKYTYLYSNLDLYLFLTVRMDVSTSMELLKVHPSARPVDYDSYIQEHGSFSQLPDFEKPDGWTYRDDDLPFWYKAWEKKNNVDDCL